ncbi:MAG: VWA domain-containing protein [Gemmatimonadales bacterium]|nr:VWA domain-containing protein [Gemmatimonadales bacterium]
MRADVQLSTKFVSTQNGHQVGMLVTLTGETPVRRAPINVALVLDRSGSMDGEPIEAAKDAARRFAGFLSPADRLAVVTFDGDIDTIFGPAAAGDPAADAAIAAVQARGNTNLSGGWLKGMHHVKSGLVDGTNRVVLLTDGQANAGIVDPAALVGMSTGASSERVSTTCIGFGSEFNEDLLEPMARQGGGNYWYVEDQDQMGAIFQAEIDGLVALAAQNVEVEVSLSHPRVAGVSFLQSYNVRTTAGNTWHVSLGDLYATSPRPLGLVFHVDDVEQLGRVQIGEVRIQADVVLEQGIEHRTIAMPVWANLDAADHIEPTVEQTLLRFEAAKAREAAISDADRGDYDGAARGLRAVGLRLAPYSADEDVAREIADLNDQAALLESRKYSAMDRKYHAAMAMGMREGKIGYVKSISRREKKDNK